MMLSFSITRAKGRGKRGASLEVSNYLHYIQESSLSAL